MKRKLYTIILIIFLAAVTCIAGVLNNIKHPKTYQPQENLTAPIEIPNTGIVPLNEISEDNKPILVMFYADWCTYCRRYMPIFGEISQKYPDTYNFAVVNCDYPENSDWVEKANIIAFPTLKIVDKKLDVIMSLDISATQNNDILDNELKQYLSLRKRIVN